MYIYKRQFKPLLFFKLMTLKFKISMKKWKERSKTEKVLTIGTGIIAVGGVVVAVRYLPKYITKVTTSAVIEAMKGNVLDATKAGMALGRYSAFEMITRAASYLRCNGYSEEKIGSILLEKGANEIIKMAERLMKLKGG